jgi:hypothetical protein
MWPQDGVERLRRLHDMKLEIGNKHHYAEWIAQQVKDFKEQWEKDHPMEQKMKEQQATAPITYEQWYKLFGLVASTEQIFNAARQGMIPADNTIAIPRVEDWPEWAKSAKFIYSEYPVGGFVKKELDVIYAIPRPTPPKPQWTPKVGDTVFAGEPETTIGIIANPCPSFLLDETDVVYNVLCQDGHQGVWRAKFIKPFNKRYIGQPWDQIPNTPEDGE